MKKILLASLIVLGAAACDQRSETPAPATAAPATADAQPAAPAETPAPAKKGGREVPTALPQGLRLAFPYHYRNEVDVVAKDGTTHRRTIVETFDDQAATIASLEASFADAGFRKRRQAARSGGGERLIFSKKNYGFVSVDLIPGEGRKLAHRKSQHIVWLQWPAAAAG